MGSELSPREAGFTLIEVVVVVAVLSVMAVGSVLALRPAGAGGPGDAAALAAAHDTARHAAVLRGRPMALHLDAAGHRAQVWQPGADAPASGPWQDAGPVTAWREAPQLDPTAAEMRIVFLPSGQASPFTLRLSGSRRCAATAWGPVECAP